MKSLFVLLPVFLWASTASANALCPTGSTCVPPEDMAVFVALLKAQKCRMDTQPKVVEDPTVIVVDREGRVYASGSDPKPHTVHLDWCNYQIDVASQTKIVVAQREEPTSGARFRLKAAFGYLPLEALRESDSGRGIDGGVLLEPLFLRWANLNAYVGIKSFGGGVGLDFTRNFGLYVGYAVSWQTWRSNPHAALYFSFW